LQKFFGSFLQKRSAVFFPCGAVRGVSGADVAFEMQGGVVRPLKADPRSGRRTRGQKLVEGLRGPEVSK
jgi:hypothetical protein